ncbi:MAG: hypothetical protein VXA66_12385 [Alphaproteobacteria bacterium]
MRRRVIINNLLALILVVGMTACGKRGDPFRPSEIPPKPASETPAS